MPAAEAAVTEENVEAMVMEAEPIVDNSDPNRDFKTKHSKPSTQLIGIRLASSAQQEELRPWWWPEMEEATAEVILQPHLCTCTRA